jgi:hypothetical protein
MPTAADLPYFIVALGPIIMHLTYVGLCHVYHAVAGRR